MQLDLNLVLLDSAQPWKQHLAESTLAAKQNMDFPVGDISPKWSFFPIIDNLCVPLLAFARIGTPDKSLYLLSRFSDEGMEVIERLIYLYHKFHQLKVSNEEYACMKAINFLNQGE